MPFFGSSTNQKNDTGALAEIPRFVLDQMKLGDARAAESYLLAQGYTNEQVATLKQQIQSGLGTPEEIRATGKAVMPGVGDLVNRNMANTEQQQQNYADVPGPQTTIDAMGNIIGDKSKRIGENYGDVQSLVDQGFGSQVKRVGDTSDSIGSDLAKTYGSAIDDSGKAYGNAQSAADTGFGKIGTDAGQTYDEVRSRINQSRDPQLGTTARAFAPAMAATLRRIRAAGIDPNSPEAASLLQRVDSARGHAFDDSMTANLNSLNQVDLAQQANQQGLDISKLSNDQQLALQAAAAKQGLTLDQYMKRTDLATQTRDLQNNLTQSKMEADVNNKNAAFGQKQNLSDQQIQQELISRGIRVDDATNKNNLLDKVKADDAVNQDLKNQEFNAGFGLAQANNAVKTNANTQLGDAAKTQYQVSGQQGAQATQNAQVADQGFGTSLAVEQPGANWGGKLLGGLAAGALNVVAPGAGTALAGATGTTASNPWGAIFKKKGGGQAETGYE